MAFDAGKYRNSVLVPLAKDKARLEVLQQVIRDVQGSAGIDAAARLNAAELYALDPAMGAAELASHFKNLEMTYNKQKHLPSAQLLKKLLELFGKDKAADSAFWARLAASRGQALKGQLDGFAKAMAEEHPLKVVTPQQVPEMAAGMGLADVPAAELAAALNKHGVEVCPDFEIPKLPLPPAVLKVTEFPEFRTIVDVVLRPEQPSDIRLIDELAVGSPARRLKPADIGPAKERLQQQEAQVEERARQAAQNALAALTEVKSDSDLHALILAAVANSTEHLLRRGLPRVAVRAELVNRGVRQLDASRLVAKLSASTQVLGLADVASRLAGGALGEARRLLEVIGPLDGEDSTERERIAARVEAAENQKRQLLVQYDACIGARDYVAAAAALREALAVDTQDDDLRTKLSRLPPLPPASLSLRVDGRALEVRWSADEDAAVKYSVLRTTAHVPVNHNDGDILVSGLASTRFRDEKAPIGTNVTYSVFATRDGSSYSDPATATSVVLPSPMDLAASPGVTEVSLSWTTPPEAAGVVITQTAPDGNRSEHTATTPGQIALRGLATGTKYRFSAKAVYLLAGAGRRESAAVEVDAIPRGAIGSVSDLQIEAVPGGHRANWSPVVGYTVELWALPVTAHVAPGTRATIAELANLGGRRLTLSPVSGARGVAGYDFEALPEVRLLVPITLDGDGGLVGSTQVAGSAPPVQRATAERFGDELRLSWEWPKGDYMIEVGWQANGSHHMRRVSRTAYNDSGGVRIKASELVGGVTLATVVKVGALEWLSAPISVPVSGVFPTVKYGLAVRRSKFFGKGSVTVTVESTELRDKVELMTVVKEAKFMPGSVSDGTMVDRRVIDFTAGSTSIYSVDLGRVATPFWVRLFPESTSEVRVEDPPTSQMRGQ
ncbi:fibronectin type III domain protein [Pseudarthrobacter siccitolerans]|uniref:Fibronectin type III domain protein n=1 Tax=Pseudarthrobacter siccitolerans TaxID=861266 RepID=A0A024GZX9_9MICC|nr:fibronectin type III domain-containing protein [Pseudarthrobacter siccitolerans]CCQ45054.1 fibronectin type III domain protein [Pseudarthrobacter siccitolerans]